METIIFKLHFFSGGFGRPLLLMPPKKGAPERKIEDKDIANQSFLFTEEATEVAPDTTAIVRYPQYVKIQRQRRILMKRLKVPPPVNHFNHTLNKQNALQVFKFLEKYKPEGKAEKKAKVQKEAAKQEKSLAPTTQKTKQALVYGIKNVTSLIEAKKAQLVVIAHDVDPLEIVVWLPALCRKLDVPYCIVKGKARLGQIVGLSTTSCIAVKDVRPEDRKALTTLVDMVNTNFLQHFKEEMHQWGGGELSEETIEKLRAQGKHD